MPPPAPHAAGGSTLGCLPPDGLIDARRQLHHVLQLVASAGRSFAEPLPDDAHANLGWMPDCRALVTRPLGTWEQKPRVALRLDKPAVALVDQDGACQVLPLAGRIRTEVAGWLRAQMALRELNAASYLLARPYEIPHHPVVDGVTYFDSKQVADGTPAELARWFELAVPALQSVVTREHGASELRCWPHHFDIATLIPLSPGQTGDNARSVGVGMSPGDEEIEQPYFYVTPWPAPADDVALPDLPLGEWHTASWTGALLTGEALLAAVKDVPDSSPAEHLTHFLAAAIPSARSLLGGKR
jgi:hypothetical protein